MKKFFKIKEKLKKSSFWSSVVTLSAGQIIAQCINVFSIPIVSRIYSKASYGDFGLVTSTATIIIGFIGFGLGSAIMVPKDDEESRGILRSTYTIQFFLSMILCVSMLLLSPYYIFFTTQLPYTVAILLMFFFINVSVLSSLMTVYVNRLKLNKVLFFNPLISTLSTLLITLPLGLIGLDMIGLYAACLISNGIAITHMLRKANPFTSLPSWNEIKFVIKKYKHFIIFQYPSNLVGTFTGQMPNQILARNFGNGALGDYAMCNKIFGLPMSLIAGPIQTVYFRTAAQKYLEGNSDLADFTYSLVTKLMLLAIVPLVIGMAFGKEISSFLLGSKWEMAGTLASILGLQYIFTFCYNCITYCRVAINLQKINLYTSIFQTIVIIGSLLIGVTVFHTLIGTISCFAVANLIYSIFNIAVNFYCLKKYTLKFILFSFIYCTICLVATVGLRIIFLVS